MDIASSPERQQMTALNNFNEQIREFYQQAVACERQAGAQNDPKVKQQFLELNGSGCYWRSAASSIKPDEVPRPPLPAALVRRTYCEKVDINYPGRTMAACSLCPIRSFELSGRPPPAYR
jgi:hypothetical protein